MTSFEDAFVKAGIIKESDILLKEQQKKKEEQEKKQQDEKRKEKSEKEWREIQNKMMPFENLWKGDKSHKFLAHLVYAFTPGGTCNFAWTDEELKSNVCCICKQKLISKDALFRLSPQLVKISMEQIRKELNGTLTAEQKFKELSEVTGGAILGIVSEKSDAAFCNPCFDVFFNWIEAKIINGDREINIIVRKRMIELGESTRQIQGAENE